ncbi:MAG: beta-lactamase family protein [Deltaproteobacteria bacterium]|nr:beta-lactamase family protein [Deltaproteobacteria bacterium]
MSSNQHPIDAAMEKGIKDGVFPGASLLVGKGEKTLWNKVYGWAQIEGTVSQSKKRPVEPSTLFDIASLTKPIATATLFMPAISEKKCALNDPLEKYFPKACQKGITLRSLLNHTSGLPAWKPYYEEILALAPGWATEDKAKDWLVEKILVEPQEAPAGDKVIYSDLGYILLGSILEQIYGKTLDLLFAQKVAGPLNLQNTFFNPLGHHREAYDNNPEHFAATESCPWRKKILSGEVMDDHAWLMGGIAGHAGLFSTAADIRKWIVSLSRFAGKSFDVFCFVPKKRNLDEPFFALGFDTPSTESSSGRHFSPNSVGHLGYSGCSFWWDLDKGIYVILLTNRVHPSRENRQIRHFRPDIHNIVMESLGLA